MIVYFDTSALVKLALNEPGSDLAHDLWERADVVASSQVVYPEARAAVAAAHRGGRIGARGLRATVERIGWAYTDLNAIALDDPLVLAAGELAERHALHGYDAVHLASALAMRAPDLVMVTWDRELGAAALAEGRAIAPAR